MTSLGFDHLLLKINHFTENQHQTEPLCNYDEIRQKYGHSGIVSKHRQSVSLVQATEYQKAQIIRKTTAAFPVAVGAVLPSLWIRLLSYSITDLSLTSDSTQSRINPAALGSPQITQPDSSPVSSFYHSLMETCSGSCGSPSLAEQ